MWSSRIQSTWYVVVLVRCRVGGIYGWSDLQMYIGTGQSEDAL